MLLETLNPNQLKAVTTTEGNILILAGAGSGKTRVLVQRISYLINQKNICPTSILGLTFTNKAAEEMRQRVAKIIGKKKASTIHLMTFHSFCMKILKSEIHHLGFTSKFTLYDEKDIKRLIQFITCEITGSNDLPIDPVVQGVSQLKNKGSLLNDKKLLPTESIDKLIFDVYKALDTALRAYNALDFDSLLTKTMELFLTFPKILEKYQDIFKYIMIDEYQDTNPVQYQISKLLSEKNGNLCVVGDDDQSIYAWRGADVEHILNFPANFTIKLEENYRSTSYILQAANAIIKNNMQRHDKTLRPTGSNGESLEIFNAPTEQEEVDAVIKRLQSIKKEKKCKWNDMAILYRSNNLSRSFEISLMQTVWNNSGSWVRGIPYQVYGGQEFFERSEIKDLSAYLRVVYNPKDQEALLRIINYPRRGISDNTLDKITQYNRKNKEPLLDVLRKIAQGNCLELNLPKRALSSVASFVALYDSICVIFEKFPPSTGLKKLIDLIGYKEAIFNEVKTDKMRQFKWENVQALISSLQNFEENYDPDLGSFLSGITLKNHPKVKRNNLDDDRLNLMTFHSAKGLEFPVVFLVGLEDHLIPHLKSQTKQGVEEERRLLYVAITRAMETLCLSMARKRPYHGKLTSCSPSSGSCPCARPPPSSCRY